ncbi:deubiquitinating enzyme [Cryptotrichosporon argae]
MQQSLTTEVQLLVQTSSISNAAVAALTGVPAGRVKVTVKGVLKEDADLAQIGLKLETHRLNSSQVVGSAETFVSAPGRPTLFLEELDQDQLAQAYS